MVTATEFEPPLAVGIFGDWGSGKSFFMRLLHDAVDDRARQAEEDLNSGIVPTEGVRFYSKVVQIRFNAWHYAETNLWASLVDHIFVRLDKWAETRKRGSEADRLFDRLATARRLTVDAAEQLVSLRREHAEATVNGTKPQRRSTSGATTLESSRAPDSRRLEPGGGRNRSGMTGPCRRPPARPPPRRRGGRHGQLAARPRGRACANARPAPVRPSDRRRRAGPRSGRRGGGRLWLQQRAEPFLAVVTGAVSTLTAVAVRPRLGADRRQTFRGGASRLSWALNRQLEKELAGEAETKVPGPAAAAVGRGRRRRGRATAAPRRLDAAEAAHDYHANSGKGRALDFVRARLAKGDYAKHLGFIATVRRDFEELSARMKPVPPAETAEARELHKAHVERLIEAAGQEGGLLDHGGNGEAVRHSSGAGKGRSPSSSGSSSTSTISTAARRTRWSRSCRRSTCF